MIGFILLLSYSCLAGIVEGVLYSKRASEAFKWNEHILFVLKMLSIGLLYLIPDVGETMDKLVVLCCWALAHPFFHDGFYYETRKRIDMPEYSWYYDYSKTSTARLEIRCLMRVCMLACALSIFTVYWQFVR